ncbi:MAG: hypothetical protein ACREFE_10890 [Limisphaerales bacterium]
MTPILILHCVAIILIASVLYAYDCLIRNFHKKYPNDWKMQGSPSGIIFQGEKWIGISSFSQIMMFLKFTFHKPSWVYKDKKLEKYWKLNMYSYFLFIIVAASIIWLTFET